MLYDSMHSHKSYLTKFLKPETFLQISSIISNIHSVIMYPSPHTRVPFIVVPYGTQEMIAIHYHEKKKKTHYT